MENYAIELIEKGKRIDGRAFDEFRKIEIRKNVAEKAEGSASVKLGETEVIAGIKMEIVKPFEDTPNEGVLMVNTEFSPLASPEFESGPPSEDAIELSRIVDRGIRESKAVKTEELVIEAGEKVWGIFIDIHIINHKGDLLNAAALAAMTALLNTRIPKIVDGKIVRTEFERKLPVEHIPITVTVCKVGNKYILDPLLAEESVIDSKLSIAIREDDKICALQKQGSKGLEFDEIETMVDLAMQKSKELRKYIE